MLRASKLCQSVSTSGPSAIWKPSPTKTSSRRSHAWVTMWAWPRCGRREDLGEVEPLGLDARGALARGELGAPGVERRAGLVGGLVEGLPGGLLLLDRGAARRGAS